MNLLVHTPASPATENGSEDESSGKTWLVQIITPALLESQRETRDLQDCRINLSSEETEARLSRDLWPTAEQDFWLKSGSSATLLALDMTRVISQLEGPGGDRATGGFSLDCLRA